MPQQPGVAGEEEPLRPASFVQPMLASPGNELAARAGGPFRPANEGQRDEPVWLFEPKLDGLRCLAVRNGPKVELWSRNRLTFNHRFPEVVDAVSDLPADNFVLDGEVVCLIGGVPDFAALQDGAGDVQYWLFDLPWLLGEDLRDLPIEQRKALLDKAVPKSRCLKVVQPLSGEPRALFQGACRDGWEGLVAKRAGSAYLGGRRPEWLKLKCSCRQELVVGGFTPPKGSRTGFGALLLGYWEDGKLMYAGKVGTGFSDNLLRDLYTKLVQLERSTSPFSAAVPDKGARFAEPELVAEVAFTNWTPDGRLRHPSFLGLRPDKAGADVGREECVPAVPGQRAGAS